MTAKASGGASNIDNNREDKRRRRKECYVRTKEGEYERLEPPVKHGEDYHVEFRISPHAEKILRQVASLFKMKPNAYAKAVVYRDIGFYEPKDRRGAETNET